jgi:peptidyl-prolyl isomerase E (cyclophilin E)
MAIVLDGKHRGFAFVTFASSADAQDAIDNMDLNELRGRVIKVNLARPMKGIAQPDGSRASKNAHSIADFHLNPRQSGSRKNGSRNTPSLWRKVEV